MNQSPLVATDEKKKSKQKKKELAKADGDYDSRLSRQRNPSSRSVERHSNSNGNAFDDSWMDVDDYAPSSYRSNCQDILPAPARKAHKNRAYNIASHKEKDNISSASVQKRNPDISDALDIIHSKKSSVVNSNRNSASLHRNSTDSTENEKKDSSYHGRGSSDIKKQRDNKGQFRNGAEGAEHSRNFGRDRPYSNKEKPDKGLPYRGDQRNRSEMDAEHRNNDINKRPASPIKPEEEKLSEEFQLLIEVNKIRLLQKKNPRFPKARFFCELCDFHLNLPQECEKHIKENRHSRMKKLHDEITVLKSIPEPSDVQFAALTAAVEKVYEEHGISDEERKQRRDIVSRLERLLKEKISDVLIFMYGSSLTGFGLKTADINVDLASASKERKVTSLLQEVLVCLKDRTDTGFSNVRSNFTAKLPGLFLTDDSTGLTVNITIHCYSAYCSSQLLAMYSDFDVRVKKLVVAFRYWAHLCGLDRHQDGYLPAQALNLMVIYFLQHITPKLVPIIVPPKVTGDETGDYATDSLAFEKRRTKVMKEGMKSRTDDVSVGELWFFLLQYYCLHFDTPNVVVCICIDQKMPRDSKPWNNKKLAVEDPYMLKKNITNMVNNPRINEYWEDSLRKAFHYFGFPRDSQGQIHTPKETSGDKPEDQNDLSSQTPQQTCHYEFSQEVLTDGKGPVLVCRYCEKEGHLKNACPDDQLPPVLPLQPLTASHLKLLSETLQQVQTKVGLSKYGLQDREHFLEDLEAFIRSQFKDAKLTLFGSSYNGFGFESSDMDICLTFTERKVIDKPFLIESLARKLKQHSDLRRIQAISTAKVPIVKFNVKSMDLEGDISLYNILAQHNTKLLQCYSNIDVRVQILGYTIKNFAKVSDIGDASRGSLSSYAFILMMLYYLQQVKPPVIPVLQQLYKGTEKPKLLIDGCDAWFMDDMSLLNELWPEKGKNTMSVAELWLGFLCFYVEQFNYKEFVVSIRQKEPLTRFEKLWNGDNLAVEDPFDVNHNLGSGLTRNMNNFIFKTFINGRMLYGTSIEDNMTVFKKYKNAYSYFFDAELLSELRPKNVRGCRNCGKMGHLMKNCPVAQKERDQKRQEKQQNKLQTPSEQRQQQKQPPMQQSGQQAQPPQQHQKQSQETQQPQPSQQPQPPRLQRQEHQQIQQRQQNKQHSQLSQQQGQHSQLSQQQGQHSQLSQSAEKQKQKGESSQSVQLQSHLSHQSEQQGHKSQLIEPLLQEKEKSQTSDAPQELRPLVSAQVYPQQPPLLQQQGQHSNPSQLPQQQKYDQSAKPLQQKEQQFNQPSQSPQQQSQSVQIQKQNQPPQQNQPRPGLLQHPDFKFSHSEQQQNQLSDSQQMRRDRVYIRSQPNRQPKQRKQRQNSQSPHQQVQQQERQPSHQQQQMRPGSQQNLMQSPQKQGQMQQNRPGQQQHLPEWHDDKGPQIQQQLQNMFLNAKHLTLSSQSQQESHSEQQTYQRQSAQSQQQLVRKQHQDNSFQPKQLPGQHQKGIHPQQELIGQQIQHQHTQQQTFQSHKWTAAQQQQHRPPPQPQKQFTQTSYPQEQSVQQSQQQLQQSGEEKVERWKPQDCWQNDPDGNMNVNSPVSSLFGPAYNFNNPRSQEPMPMPGSLISQMYHNRQHQQPFLPYQGAPHNFYMQNSQVSLPPGFIAPPGYPPPPQLSPPQMPPANRYISPPPGHPVFQSRNCPASHNTGGGFSYGNSDSRSYQTTLDTYKSAQGNENTAARSLFTSPAVQRMFDSTGGKVVYAGSEQYHRQQ